MPTAQILPLSKFLCVVSNFPLLPKLLILHLIATKGPNCFCKVTLEQVISVSSGIKRG